MISKNKETHLYLKFDNNQKDAFDFDLLSFNFISDVILDLSSLETIDKTLVSFLKPNQSQYCFCGILFGCCTKRVPIHHQYRVTQHSPHTDRS